MHFSILPFKKKGNHGKRHPLKKYLSVSPKFLEVSDTDSVNKFSMCSFEKNSNLDKRWQRGFPAQKLTNFG